MSTSVSEQITLISSTLYGTDDDPVDSVLMRRGVANNLMHMCDSMGQVRVNFVPVLSSYAGNLNAHVTIDGPDYANKWYLFGGMPLGPWPLTMRADGTPYRLIIQAYGSISAGLGTGTFRVVIAPSYYWAARGLEESSDRVWQGTTTSTTVASVAGFSQGDNAAADYMDVDREVALSWISTVHTHDAVSGASPVSIEQCLVSAWVFAKTTNVGAIPRLHGLRLAEYIAP